MARLGELDLYDDDEGANPIDIPLIKATMHEDYNPTTFTNDIAILTLKFTADVRKLQLNKHISFCFNNIEF